MKGEQENRTDRMVSVDVKHHERRTKNRTDRVVFVDVKHHERRTREQDSLACHLMKLCT